MEHQGKQLRNPRRSPEVEVLEVTGHAVEDLPEMHLDAEAQAQLHVGAVELDEVVVFDVGDRVDRGQIRPVLHEELHRHCVKCAIHATCKVACTYINGQFLS